MDDDGGRLSRRALVGGAAGIATASTAGCLDRLRNRVSRDSPEPVSVTVKTVPADDDERAVTVARHLATNLEAAGVDTTVVPMAETELRRDVLLDHDFDVYVGRSPSRHEPDFLLSLLHSGYASQPGWQNPFGYADIGVDDALVAQRRRSGESRRRALAELQRLVVAEGPLAVVAVPDEIHAVRPERFVNWSMLDADRELGVLGLEPRDGVDASELRFAVTDDRPTRNLNPLAVEFREYGTITGLLYDGLAAWGPNALEPRLAEDWAWSAIDPPVVEVTLRDDLRWHDGTPLTAADVAFTYEFIADTSLGRAEEPVPAPRFQGRASLVEDATLVDDSTVRLDFVDSSASVAERALTVPVLPEHVWADRATLDVVGGVELSDSLPPALTMSNLPAVGSGPLRFESATSDERLVLARYDDHYLHRDEDGGPAQLDSSQGVSVERVTFTVVPSDSAAVAVTAAGDVDAVASPLGPASVPAIERASALDLVVGGTPSFYHVGFNVRRAPLSNPRFRRVTTRLLDREHLVSSAFDGYARTAVGPLDATKWAVRADTDRSFLGTNGTVDSAAAQAAFRDAGFRYDEDDRLVMG